MKRNVLAIERSPLAVNIYAMLLKKLGDVEISAPESVEKLDEIISRPRRFDLIIISEKTVSERGKEVADKLAGAFGRTPLLVLAQEGSETSGGLARPFLPDAFVKAVERLWSVR